MAGNVIKNILVRVGADTNQLNKGLNNAKKSMKDFQGSQQRAVRGINDNFSKMNMSIKGSFNGFSKSVSESSNSLTTMGAAAYVAKSALGRLAIVATSVYYALNNSATKLAMEYEASFQQINRLLQGNTKQFIDWTNTQAKSLNMSKADAVKYGAVYANLVGNFTTNTSKIATHTQDLLKASAIIASATGREMTDVMERMRSGLLGNTEAIEDLGVNVNVAMLESTAAFQRLANGKSWNQLSFQVQQQIRLYAILEQTSKKFGTAVNNNTTSSVAQLNATLKNTVLNLGQALLPIVNKILPILITFAEKLESASQKLKEVSFSIFGVKDAEKQLTQTSKVATKAEDKLGDAIKETTDKAKRGIAPFDEINEIQENISDSAIAAATSLESLTDSGFKNLDKLIPDASRNKDSNIIAFPGSNQPPMIPPIDPAPVTAALETIKSKIDQLKSKIPINIVFGPVMIADTLISLALVLSKVSEIVSKTPINISFSPIVTEATILSLSTVLTPLNEIIGKSIISILFSPILTPVAIASLKGVINTLNALWALTPIGIIFSAITTSDAITSLKSVINTLNTLWALTPIGIVFSTIATLATNESLQSVITTLKSLLALTPIGIIFSAITITPTIASLQSVIDTLKTLWDKTPVKITFAALVVSPVLIQLGKVITKLSELIEKLIATENQFKTFKENSLVLLQEFSTKAKEIIKDLKLEMDKVFIALFLGTSAGLVAWILSNAKNIGTFAVNFYKSIYEMSKNSWKAFGSFLSFSSDWLTSWANVGIGLVYGWAKTVYSYIADLATSVGSTISRSINWTKEKVVNGFKDIGEFMSENKEWIVPVAVAGLTAAGIAATVASGGLAAPAAAAIVGAAVTAGAMNANTQKIPQLATGGIVTSPTLAMIGEAGTEAVVPLENTGFVDTMASKIGSAVLSAMQFGQQENGTINVNLNINGTTLARELIPIMNNEQNRIGNAIIQGV